MSQSRSFQFRVSEESLTDLRQRLCRTRLADEPPLEPWSTGTSIGYLHNLLAYWRDDFDWRAQEEKLAGFRQFTVPLAGIDLHYIHEQGRGPRPLPLLLAHGWPGSVWEFHRLIPMLTDPVRFGADPAAHRPVLFPDRRRLGVQPRPGVRRREIGRAHV